MKDYEKIDELLNDVRSVLQGIYVSVSSNVADMVLISLMNASN